MKNWQDDKRRSDVYLPEIKSILGMHLIVEPDFVEDMEHNTDLIVLKMRDVRIACRVRNYKYWQQYKNEFTIRAGRPSGQKTELTKIIMGWGDYFFYGFSNEETSALHDWRIFDLNIFRYWFTQSIATNKGRIPGNKFSNTDGSSNFLVFSVNDFPKDFVVAKKDFICCQEYSKNEYEEAIHAAGKH